MRILYIIIAIILSIIPIYQNEWRNNVLVDVTYIIICIFSIFGIFNKRNVSFSLYKMFYMFSLFFFGISAYIQYSKGIVFWKNESSYLDTDYIFTNCIIIFILFVFEFIYTVYYNYKINKIDLSSTKEEASQIFIKSGWLCVIVSILMFIITLNSKNWDIFRLFIRGSELDEPTAFGPLEQVISNFCRPYPMILFLVYYSLKKRFNLIGTLLFIIAILSNFPTGLARYNAAALYIPLVLIVLPIVGKKFNFNLIFVLGLLVLFPFLNNFRRFSSDLDFKIEFNFEMFEEGHFDSYSSLLRIMKYDIITYGEQLLGVFLFWVPRSLWPNKPVGSGVEMAERLQLDFSNIACNFFAEGYINFGFIGILIFTVFISVLFSFLDLKYLSKKGKDSFEEVQYFLLVGFAFFLLRGDLLSSFAYLVGFNVSLITVKLLCGKRNNTSLLE